MELYNCALYGTVQLCTALYYTTVHWTALNNCALYCTVLYCALYCISIRTRQGIYSRIKTFVWGSSIGTSWAEGKGLYLIVYPKSSPNRDSISFFYILSREGRRKYTHCLEVILKEFYLSIPSFGMLYCTALMCTTLQWHGVHYSVLHWTMVVEWPQTQRVFCVRWGWTRKFPFGRNSAERARALIYSWKSIYV